MHHRTPPVRLAVQVKKTTPQSVVPFFSLKTKAIVCQDRLRTKRNAKPSLSVCPGGLHCNHG